MTAKLRPYRIEVPGTSLAMRCEAFAFAVAVLEAEKLARRMKVAVKVCHGAKLVKTVKP